jgi:hypothetical protein
MLVNVLREIKAHQIIEMKLPFQNFGSWQINQILIVAKNSFYINYKIQNLSVSFFLFNLIFIKTGFLQVKVGAC